MKLEKTSDIDNVEDLQKKAIFNGLLTFHFLNDGLELLFPILMVSYVQRFNLQLSEVGNIFSINIVMVIIVQLINGYLADKGKSKQILIIGIIGITISGYFFLFINGKTAMIIASIISGVFFGFVHSIHF